MGGCRAPPRVTPGKGDVGEFPAMAIRRGRLGYLCGLSDGMLMLRRGQKLHKRNSLHKLIYKRKALWQRQSTILSWTLVTYYVTLPPTPPLAHCDGVTRWGDTLLSFNFCFLIFLILGLRPQVENRCLPAESPTLSGVPPSAQWMPHGRVRIPQLEEAGGSRTPTNWKPSKKNLLPLMLPLIFWEDLVYAVELPKELQTRWDWNPCLQELHWNWRRTTAPGSTKTSSWIDSGQLHPNPWNPPHCNDTFHIPLP